MISYLISFSLCSGLLLLVYRLVLSRQQMFGFNRFYLLASLALSLAIPALTIPAWWKTAEKPVVYQPIVYQPENVAQVNSAPDEVRASAAVVKEFNWALAMQLLYAAVTLVLITRFSINLFRIIQKARKAMRVEMNRGYLLLTGMPEPPHTFFNYIFLSEADYEAGAIPAEVICHEQAHARQLHTLDVLFVELLQALCWFNPLIPFYRRAIQLNHEYLADAAVVNNYENAVGYQHLILAMSSVSGGGQSAVALSSQFNYQTVKNRLVMITKTTSRSMAICRQMVVLPAVVAAVLLFSQKSEAALPAVSKPVSVQQKLKSDTIPHVKREITSARKPPYPIMEVDRIKYSKTDASASVMDEYASIMKKYNLSDTSGNTKDITAEDKDRLHTLFIQMSKGQQDAQWVRFRKADDPIPKSKVTNAQLKTWQADARAYGVWVDDKRIKNADLAKYTAKDFDVMMFSGLRPNAIKNDGFRFQVDLMTKAYYADYNRKIMADRSDKMSHWRHGPRKK